MVKGFIAKSEWKAKVMPFFVYREKKEYDDWLSLDWPPIEVVIFTAEEFDEIKNNVENIRIMARNNPEELAGDIVKDSEAALKILEGVE